MLSKQDNRQYAQLAVSTVPAAPNTFTSANNILNAGQSGTFIVTTHPDSSQLSLWNFLFSIYIDLPGLGGGGGANQIIGQAYNFPDGSALTAGQLLLNLNQWLDYAESSDISNVRVHKIRLTNNDSVQHTYTLYYKAYTVSRTAASSG